jgi:hypothetical protein
MRTIETNTLHYCIGCRDKTSNTIGSFGYDNDVLFASNEFHAITPVFYSVMDFYKWAKKEGYKSEPFGYNNVMHKGI